MYVSTQKKLNSEKGFSLMELMIVVVIIGLLATVGVPTYRKMVQKSRKSEAQVMLGGILTAENAFHAEYGTYGNNLDKLGVTMPDNEGIVYRGGFTANDGSCGDATVFPSSIFKFSAYPDNHKSTIGRSSQDVCHEGSATSATAFTAFATGYIRSVSDTAPRDNCDGDVENCDVWSIDQDGVLDNVNDGIK